MQRKSKLRYLRKHAKVEPEPLIKMKQINQYMVDQSKLPTPQLIEIKQMPKQNKQNVSNFEINASYLQYFLLDHSLSQQHQIINSHSSSNGSSSHNISHKSLKLLDLKEFSSSSENYLLDFVYERVKEEFRSVDKEQKGNSSIFDQHILDFRQELEKCSKQISQTFTRKEAMKPEQFLKYQIPNYQQLGMSQNSMEDNEIYGKQLNKVHKDQQSNINVFKQMYDTINLLTYCPVQQYMTQFLKKQDIQKNYQKLIRKCTETAMQLFMRKDAKLLDCIIQMKNSRDSCNKEEIKLQKQYSQSNSSDSEKEKQERQYVKMEQQFQEQKNQQQISQSIKTKYRKLQHLRTLSTAILLFLLTNNTQTYIKATSSKSNQFNDKKSFSADQIVDWISQFYLQPQFQRKNIKKRTYDVLNTLYVSGYVSVFCLKSKRNRNLKKKSRKFSLSDKSFHKFHILVQTIFQALLYLMTIEAFREKSQKQKSNSLIIEQIMNDERQLRQIKRKIRCLNILSIKQINQIQMKLKKDQTHRKQQIDLSQKQNIVKSILQKLKIQKVKGQKSKKRKGKKYKNYERSIQKEKRIFKKKKRIIKMQKDKRKMKMKNGKFKF